MKKQKSFLLIIISILMLLSMGCGSEVTEAINTEIAEANEIEGNPYNITKEELLSFTWEETEDFFEKNIPNYRTVFAIEGDRVLTSDDWIALRDLLSISLFKSAVLDSETQDTISTGEDEINTIIGNNYEGVDLETKESIQNYLIYGFLVKSDINDMSLEEFKEFMPKYYTWALGTAEGYEESFGSLTEEQWIECKDNFVLSLPDEIPTEDIEEN